mgnify:CR=1 FL=1
MNDAPGVEAMDAPAPAVDMSSEPVTAVPTPIAEPEPQAEAAPASISIASIGAHVETVAVANDVPVAPAPVPAPEDPIQPAPTAPPPQAPPPQAPPPQAPPSQPVRESVQLKASVPGKERAIAPMPSVMQQQQQQQHQQMAGVQVQQAQQIQPQMATASMGDLAQYQHLQQLQQLQHLQQLQQQQSLQKLHAMQQQQRLLSQLGGGGGNITQAQLAQLTGASNMNAGALGQMNAAGLAQGLNTQGMTPSQQAAFANQLITSQHQHALLEQALKQQKEKEEAEERAALDADYARIAAAARAPPSAQVPTTEERVAKRPREEQPARPHHQPTQPVALKVPNHLHLQYQQAQRAVREGADANAPPAPHPAAPQTDVVAPPGKLTPAVIYPSTGRPSAAMKRSNERSAISLGATVLDEPDPMDGDDWFSMDAAARFKALMPRYARLTAELRDARDALESEVQVRKGLEEALREARREARAAKASEDRIVSSLRSITASNAGLSPEMKARLRMTHETPPMSEEQLRGLIEVPESREGA